MKIETIENRAQYNRDLNERLTKYCKSSGDNLTEVKQYFTSQADPYNMKNETEANNIYCRLVNDFLTKEGL